jgi:hypothetical protein
MCRARKAKRIIYRSTIRKQRLGAREIHEFTDADAAAAANLCHAKVRKRSGSFL